MNKIANIYYEENNPSIMRFDDGKKEKSKCINCKNKKCIYYKEDEINDTTVEIPKNISLNVCPNNAIYEENGKVKINKEKCIGCCLCISRCTTGAIYLHNNKAEISEYGIGNENDFDQTVKLGNMVKSDKKALEECYKKIKENNINPNIISRNLLMQCGISTFLSRKGDVSLRMDGIIRQNNNYGPLEIEFGNEVLDCPRNILDDIAVLCSRYNYKKEILNSLIVCLSLPNNRTDYWRVIKDIENILKIKIYTISIGGLLEIIWNNKQISINELPYLNSEDNSLKEKIEKIIERKIELQNDINSIFDTLK